MDSTVERGRVVEIDKVYVKDIDLDAKDGIELSVILEAIGQAYKCIQDGKAYPHCAKLFILEAKPNHIRIRVAGFTIVKGSQEIKL